MMNSIPDDKAFTQPAPPFSADGWNSAEVPADGAEVEVLASDHRGLYRIPFPVLFRGDRWLNANTAQELDTYIEGWRPRRAEQQVGRA